MNTEKDLHKQVCTYIKYQYPSVFFHTDLSGVYLSGRWSLLNQVKTNNSHSGFPDLMILERRGNYNGLIIELKKEGEKIYNKQGLPKNEHIFNQKTWLDMFDLCGFKSTFAIGFDETISIIDNYLT